MITLKQKIICFTIIIITFGIIIGTVIASGMPQQYEITVGQVCPEDIYASRNIVDAVSTKARRVSAAEGVEDVYVTDSSLTDASIEKVNKAISEIYTAREKKAESSALTLFPDAVITLDNTTYLSRQSFDNALNLSSSEYEALAKSAPLAISAVMGVGVTDVEIGIENCRMELEKLSLSPNVLSICLELCEGAITENKTYDPIATQEKREEAANAISNITYMKNQVIARRGEIITEAQYQMLSELGFVKGEGNLDLFHTASIALLLISVFALVLLYYIFIGRTEVPTSPIITSVICSILCVLASFIIFLAAKGSDKLIYLMPLAMVPALISLLLNSNLATMVNILVSVLAGIQTDDLSVALALVIAGAATSYLFSRVRRRSHLLPATASSALAYAISFTSIFIGTSKNIFDIFCVFLLALLGGFLGGILTIGTVPFWEGMFDVITPMKLGELSNPEHKLLKKLLLKAPGSYHHSLTVANMADAAAAACGANALLARVGAYYHDIGKMEDPLYFKENQFGDLNPHDLLDPKKSAEIILKHVSDGAHLASTHRLPSAVRDIIVQHHGTTTASYFLYKAKELDKDIDPGLFTYPGPTPTSKEATIIMLADACEAAVRAMREKGDVDIRKVVDNIVATRISEGQLSASSLTFADLDKVKDSFVQTLDQYFHKRILYPQNKETQE